MYHCVGLPFVRPCKKTNDYCSIFEEDTTLNVRVGWVRKNVNFATWYMHMFVYVQSYTFTVVWS